MTIIDCSELPRLCGLVDPAEIINPSQSNQCVGVALDKRKTTDVEPVTGTRTRDLRRRVYYYQRIKHWSFETDQNEPVLS